MQYGFLSALSRAGGIATVGFLAYSLFSGLSPQPGYAAKGGSANETNYDVKVVDDPSFWPFPEGPAGPYEPSMRCLGDTPGGAGNFAVIMPDECGIVTLYDEVRDLDGNLSGYAPGNPVPYQLKDNLGFRVTTLKDKKSRKNYFYSIVLHGQEDIGQDSSWHESREMRIFEDEAMGFSRVWAPDPPEEFTLHVHKTVPVEIYDSHLDTGSNQPLKAVGYISVGDLIFTPQH